jgi:uncharacterized membrane protein YfcA
VGEGAVGVIVLFTFLAGTGAGALGALLGLGGGIFLVPFLNLGMGVPLEQAMAISLVTVIATSNFVSQASAGRRLSNVRLAMVLQVVSAIGANAGTYNLENISARTREQIFGGTALLVALVMLSRLNQRNILHGSIRDVGMLGGWVPDADTGELVAYRLKRLPLAMGVAGGAGVISTLTGTGGGVLVAPALNSWCGIPMRVAAATSAVIIGVTAIPGVVDNFANGHLTRPVLAASAVLGVLAGSRAGFWIGEKVTVRALKILMAVVLSIVAVEYLVFQ